MATATAARKPATKRTVAAKPQGARAQRNAQAIQRARGSVASPAPATPRRKSGPAVRKPMGQRTVALPRPRIARVAQGGASLFLDSILRGRAWVAVVGILLAGIVYLNVSVLQLNRGIAENAAKTDRLEIVNSKLRGRVGKLDNAERIQQLAEQRGLHLPQPGEVTYMKPRRLHDAKLAATRITAPDEATSDVAATTAAPVTPEPAAVAPAPTTPEPVTPATTTAEPVPAAATTTTAVAPATTP
jgi:cell division protein FtsL